MAEESQEVQLARKLIAGDVSAFEPFVRLFHQKLFQYVLLTCGNREDAEEVAQETLLKVFQSFDQLRDPAHVRSWVLRIARNYCYMKRRKSVYAPEEEISLDALAPGFRDDGGERRLEVADWSRVPENLAMNSELAELLRASIRELPEIYRSALLLRDVAQLSTQEAAQVLGVSEDVVKTRLHRARLAVRQKLDRHLLASWGIQ